MLSFINKIKQRDTNRKDAFISFYKNLVTSIDLATANNFGRLNVDMTNGKTWGIELSLEDYLFWELHLAKGDRFKQGFTYIKHEMIRKLVSTLECMCETSEERTELLEMVKKYADQTD